MLHPAVYQGVDFVLLKLLHKYSLHMLDVPFTDLLFLHHLRLYILIHLRFQGFKRKVLQLDLDSGHT